MITFYPVSIFEQMSDSHSWGNKTNNLLNRPAKTLQSAITKSTPSTNYPPICE